ncbi:MAG: hypothetical protein ACYDHP_09040 [Ferrimicrobium sp.]
MTDPDPAVPFEERLRVIDWSGPPLDLVWCDAGQQVRRVICLDSRGVSLDQEPRAGVESVWLTIDDEGEEGATIATLLRSGRVSLHRGADLLIRLRSELRAAADASAGKLTPPSRQGSV